MPLILLVVGLFAAWAIANIVSPGQGATSVLADLGFSNQSPSQIAVLARNAGFSGDDLAVAIAVAMAESSGNPNAYNPEAAAGAPDGMGSFGLWQIYLNAHPEFQNSNLYDPQANANAAHQIYLNAGQSFSPWTTFRTGAYEQYLPVAQAITGG